MMAAAQQLGRQTSVLQACRQLSVPRSSFYRRGRFQSSVSSRPTPAHALSPQERAEVRQILNSERFRDQAPREVYATLLDEGVYLCHWRTMYRILAEHQEVRGRRNQLQHPPYAKPELVATGPNQLWSWDITKLKGPSKWLYFYLYVILDVFSRFVVGWLLAEQESEILAQQLIAETCDKQNIAPEQLIIHADRGAAMRAKTVGQLMIDLGVTKSHSRPHTATDNAYSESQFKTMKYQPDYPDRFVSYQTAHDWSHSFFQWYNFDHHHTGLALLTPAVVHNGLTDQVQSQRLQVLMTAYHQHPERFIKGSPSLPELPNEVWINQPLIPEPDS